ncbi:Uncharacterised protein [Haemophilus influenzae]|nr:Uncharacterised protein [Haemophilus influenzae]
MLLQTLCQVQIYTLLLVEMVLAKQHLNGMIKSYIDKTDNNEGGFYEKNPLNIFPGNEFKPIGDDYFSVLLIIFFFRGLTPTLRAVIFLIVWK